MIDGPLSLLYSQDGLRRICWHGTELVRAITWPIRDTNWGTYPLENIQQSIEQLENGFTGTLSFSVADGALECALRFQASQSEGVLVEMTMTPSGSTFSTNRAGLTVLHPIKGVAGHPLLVTHSDGSQDNTEFPKLISPSQPVKDISGLRYSVDGLEANIVFTGEVFEMEDQRNWSDASYKTYCVPLVPPFVYEVTETITQTVAITFDGIADDAVAPTSGSAEPVITAMDEVTPAIGLVVEEGWTGDAATENSVAKTGVSHLLARCGPDVDVAYLKDVQALAQKMQAAVDVEMILPDAADAGSSIRNFVSAIKDCVLEPVRLTALRGAYLASWQPSGDWPDGPTPTGVCQILRQEDTGALVGAGMLTNFTELNRCQPSLADYDFLTHASTAIVHASDDMSVLETLETLPQIYASAQAMNAGKPYRLGLVSIGMRTNPYGASVAENPMQVRRTMAKEDPRHRGLFGAAWAVGVLASTEGGNIEALCLAAPTGPFGIANARQAYPQVGYDDNADAIVYPLFHVVKEACSIAGQPRLTMHGLPPGIASYGAQQDGLQRLIVANVTDRALPLGFGAPASAALLSTHTFDAATTDADWLEKAARFDVSDLELEPFGVAFITRKA